MKVAERPYEVGVEGVYSDRQGVHLRFVGHLSVRADNSFVMNGDTEFLGDGNVSIGPLTQGTFRGKCHDGCEVNVEQALVESMNINMRTTLRLSGHEADLSHLRASAHPGEAYREVTAVVTWALSHSTVLWNGAHRFFSYPTAKLRALGVDPAAILTARGEVPRQTHWEHLGAKFSIAYHERDNPSSDEEFGYPVAATRFFPVARFEIYLDRVESDDVATIVQTAQHFLDHALDVVAFMEGSPVVWYERVEEFRIKSQDPMTTSWIHLNRHHRFGRVPRGGGSGLRQLQWGRRLGEALPMATLRFMERSDGLGAAMNARLLALDASSGTARVLLLSTALEALKEQFLRDHGQATLLTDEQFATVDQRLRAALDACWTDDFGPPSHRGTMKAHLRQLNRPTYRSVVERLCAELGVDLNSVGGPEFFSFVPIRDKVVHTGRVESDTDLSLHLRRMSIVVEALIAAYLGLTPPQGQD